MNHWPTIREALIAAWHVILDYDRKFSDAKRLQMRSERKSWKDRRLERDRILADNGKGFELMSQRSETSLEPNFRVRVVIEGVEMAAKERSKYVGHATSRQIAFLTYMGIRIDDELSKEDAHQIIENTGNDIEFGGNRTRNWYFDRMVLYPELYSGEIANYLEYFLPHEFHEFLYTQYAGNSERITKAKIGEAIRHLTRENAGWWHDGERNSVLLERFKAMFPKCCDGAPPKKLDRRRYARHASRESGKSPGCLVLFAAPIIFISALKILCD